MCGTVIAPNVRILSVGIRRNIRLHTLTYPIGLWYSHEWVWKHLDGTVAGFWNFHMDLCSNSYDQWLNYYAGDYTTW